MKFVLSIVLDSGTREVNKIHKNHPLADILDMTPVVWVMCKSDGDHAGGGWRCSQDGQEGAHCRHKCDRDPEAVQEAGDVVSGSSTQAAVAGVQQVR